MFLSYKESEGDFFKLQGDIFFLSFSKKRQKKTNWKKLVMRLCRTCSREIHPTDNQPDTDNLSWSCWP